MYSRFQLRVVEHDRSIMDCKEEHMIIKCETFYGSADHVDTTSSKPIDLTDVSLHDSQCSRVWHAVINERIG